MPNMMQFAGHFDYLQAAFIVGVVLVFLFMWLAHRSGSVPFDLLDTVRGPDGKASLTKIAQAGAFMVSTWAFVHLVVYDRLTEWYYTSYMVAWAGTQVLTYFIGKRAQQEPPPSQGP